MGFWNDDCQRLQDYCWKPTLQPLQTKQLNTNSWYEGSICNFDCQFPILTTNNTKDVEYTFSRKIRIIPNKEQKQQLIQWWHAYRYTYNKTIEGIIFDTDSEFETLQHVSPDNSNVETGYRSEITPNVNVSIKVTKAKNNPIKLKLFTKYPKVGSWIDYKNRFVIKKREKTLNPFFDDPKHHWLLNTYKTIRTSACRDACANYKTVRTLLEQHGRHGTISTMGFKSKKTDSWSIGMEACNVKKVKIRCKRKTKRKHNKQSKTVQQNFIQVCDIKTPIRCKEWFEDDFGDPHLHKDKFGDFWLLLPYTRIHKQEVSLKPLCALDSGIKTFITAYSTNGDMNRLGTNQKHIINNLLRQDKETNEDKLIGLRKKLKNRLDDLHWKVANQLTKDHNTIILGKLKVKQILESSSITKTAKRKLSALSMYKFKERLLYKGMSKGVDVQVYSEYGTTKTCPCCGTWNSKIKLGDSVFSCSNCLYTADRDDKAALCLFVKYEAKQ